MNIAKKIGMLSVFSISMLANIATAAETPNSSIDLTYDGIKLLDHFHVKNAHRTVGKLDDEKVALETSFTEHILSESGITSVNYMNIGDNLKLEFVGRNSGLVDVNISQISLSTNGRGKESWKGISVRYDWELSVSDMELTAQYNFITGEMTNVELLDTYTVDTEFDVSGVAGFFVDVFKAVGIVNLEHDLELDKEAEIAASIKTMFNERFSNTSKTFFALDQVIPSSIIYQGQNIAPQLVDALVAPINGRKVTITTDLGTSTNQTLTVNLWDKFVVTARRLKPVIGMARYEYDNCMGNNRSGTLTWSNTGSGSNYTLQQKAGSNWYGVFTGSNTSSDIGSFSGNKTLRLRAIRQGVLGEWRNTTARNPSCSFGGGGGFEIP